MKLSRTTVGALLLLSLFLCQTPAAQSPGSTAPAVAPTTRAEMREFLLTAKVVRSRDIGKGVTRPKRLTLVQGSVTHDAAFQAVNEKSTIANMSARGRAPTVEFNFVDHYRYNLAAYALSEELGLEYMMPVHVKRRWNGKEGSLSWWVDTLMDEGERLKRKIQPPDVTDWNNQMYRMRAFAALVRDTDRNLGNVLITPDWKVVMIDFTRAFRLQTELIYGKDLQKVDRSLLAKIGELTKESVKAATGDELTGHEIDAILKRRDVIVAHFRKLIAELGEDRVLY